jgi:CRISPR type III-A-associated protein Csm2
MSQGFNGNRGHHHGQNRFDGRSGQGWSGRGGRNDIPMTLPDGYLANGYFDEKGYPFRQLFIDWPEELATKFRQGKMTASALRNFYNEVRIINSVAEGLEFEQVRERIWKLKPRAHYAANRKAGNTPFLFYQFIVANLPHAEQSLKAFKTFVSHFECVVAFFKE